MLPPDIDTADALRGLSVPDDRPGALGRRRFLQALGLGLGGAVIGPQVLAGMVPGWEELAEATPIGPTDGVLVVILMGGGNDGLNMVVPTGQSAYYTKRGALAIGADRALPIGTGTGLHPNLSYVKQRFDQGQVAVVQGVGYPNPDLSHFTSMATWMQAWGPGGPPTSGWLGRWLDGLDRDPLRAIAIGSSVPLHLVGTATKATAVGGSSPAFGVSDDPNDLRMFQVLRDLGSASTGTGTWGDVLAANERVLMDTSTAVAPAYTPTLPQARLVTELTLAARLLNLGLGTRVIGVSYGDFDSHADQPAMHDDRMAELDAGLQAFFATLDPAMAGRTTVMTFSEFGRTLERNGSNGTDHGTASSMLLVGAGVRGGLHGQLPSLTTFDRSGRLIATSDFRSVLAPVLDRWLAADSTQILGGSFTPFDLFAATPGTVDPPPPPPVVGSTPATFVPLVPARILDTRDGTGGTRAPVAAGSPRSVVVAGQGGVPVTGATAAVLNVTVTEPSAAGWLSVHPSGETPPLASNLNFVAGQTIPNLVVAKLGGDGRVVLTNGFGTAHAVADVVGYFTPDGGSRLLALSPSRLLDTRDGTGRSGSRSPIGPGGSIDLTVVGVGGVPATGVDAVVLNVTATEPTAAGYLTVWPTGQNRPVASSLNFVAGETAPNLVVAKVGAGGKVSVYNAFGSAHCVADVVGCFVTDPAAAEHVALTPSRVLDTRDGTGRPGPGAVARGQVVDLQVTGRGGVPSSGVNAVLLNLTVTEPTTEGYVTVWPSGQTAPLASNLNVVAGQTRANLVLATVGAGGKVSLRGTPGACHLVADVAGWF